MFSAAICTLGCKLNQLESEALAGAFTAAGFALRLWAETGPLGEPEAVPDILMINTCTVTSKADQKARRIIRKALRDNPHACVIVTGCYARLDPDEIEALGGGPSGGACAAAGRRLFVFRGGDKSALLDLPRCLGEALSRCPGADIGRLIRDWNNSRVPDTGEAASFRFAPESFAFHTRSFLKIQDGCDSRCAYCRVRLARGPSRSLDSEQALAELRALEAKGYAEAMITGVNITQYRDGGPASGGLEALLARLLEGTRHIALRLSSLEPEGVTGALAAVLAHRRIRPHFHLSVQSGSGLILAKMGRSYEPADVERAAALLRSVKADPFLAADIITGFPGETEAEFEKTHALCRNIRFAWIHAFPYSKRPGTPACSFSGTVSGRDAARRTAILLELARWGRADYIHRWNGRETGVLVESETTPLAGYCRGTAENYLKLLVRYAGPRPPLPGTALRCRIREAPPVCEAGAGGSQAGAGYDAEADELQD